MRKSITNPLKLRALNLSQTSRQWLWFVGLWCLGLLFVGAVKLVWVLLRPLLP